MAMPAAAAAAVRRIARLGGTTLQAGTACLLVRASPRSCWRGPSVRLTWTMQRRDDGVRPGRTGSRVSVHPETTERAQKLTFERRTCTLHEGSRAPPARKKPSVAVSGTSLIHVQRSKCSRMGLWTRCVRASLVCAGLDPIEDSSPLCKEVTLRSSPIQMLDTSGGAPCLPASISDPEFGEC